MLQCKIKTLKKEKKKVLNICGGYKNTYELHKTLGKYMFKK